MSDVVQIWTDGSANNFNQAAGGGIGVVLRFRNRLKMVSVPVPGPCTTIYCELFAIYYALSLIQPHFDVHVKSDNEWVLDVIRLRKATGLYPVEFEDIAAFKRKTIANGHKIEFSHVKGHSGILENEIADRCAGRARKTRKVFEYVIENCQFDDVNQFVELFGDPAPQRKKRQKPTQHQDAE